MLKGHLNARIFNGSKFVRCRVKEASVKRKQKSLLSDSFFFLVAFSSFRKAREDLDAKSQKLAEMEADYGDVVPRRDFERLEAQFNVSVPFTVFPKRKAETVKT